MNGGAPAEEPAEACVVPSRVSTWERSERSSSAAMKSPSSKRAVRRIRLPFDPGSGEAGPNGKVEEQRGLACQRKYTSAHTS